MPIINTPLNADDSNLDEILKQRSPVILFVWDSRHGLVHGYSEALEQTAKAKAGKLVIAILDIANSPKTKQRYGFRGRLPLILFFRDATSKPIPAAPSAPGKFASLVDSLLRSPMQPGRFGSADKETVGPHQTAPGIQISKLEKFGLVTGIIGLVADIIGIGTFLLGVWSPMSPDSSPGELPLVFKIISGLLLFYGWLAISWYLSRKSFILLIKKELPLFKKGEIHRPGRRTATIELSFFESFFYRVILNPDFGIGILLLFPSLSWFIAIIPTDYSIFVSCVICILFILIYPIFAGIIIVIKLLFMPQMYSDMENLLSIISVELKVWLEW